MTAATTPGGGAATAGGIGFQNRVAAWIDWIAIAPSPTTDVTRLTELSRTVPVAKAPGMVVSGG